MIRHEREFGPGPQVFVTPMPGQRAGVLSACGAVGPFVDLGDRVHVPIPPAARTSHESHFTQVLKQFVGHFHQRAGIASWERRNLMAKYSITTRGVQLGSSVHMSCGS
jgi:hypothetical protein